MIDLEILSFADVPNLADNPIPRHYGTTVNALEDDDEGLVKDVSKVKAFMKVVRAKSLEAGLIIDMHDKCKVCLFALDQCVEFNVYL